MTNIDKLREILSARHVGDIFEKDMVNVRFITNMDNCAEEMLAVVETAKDAARYYEYSFSGKSGEREREDLRENNSCSPEYGIYLDLKKALKAFDLKLAETLEETT